MARNTTMQVVYVPLIRPPSVQRQDYFLSRDFPDNMPRVWDLLFGSVPQVSTQHPLFMIAARHVTGHVTAHVTAVASSTYPSTLCRYTVVRVCMSHEFVWSHVHALIDIAHANSSSECA